MGVRHTHSVNATSDEANDQCPAQALLRRSILIETHVILIREILIHSLAPAESTEESHESHAVGENL